MKRADLWYDESGAEWWSHVHLFFQAVQETLAGLASMTRLLAKEAPFCSQCFPPTCLSFHLPSLSHSHSLSLSLSKRVTIIFFFFFFKHRLFFVQLLVFLFFIFYFFGLNENRKTCERLWILIVYVCQVYIKRNYLLSSFHFFCPLFHFEMSQNIILFLKIKIINLLIFLLYPY